MKIKKIMIIAITLCFMLGVGTAFALEPVKIIVNGKEVIGDTPAQIVSNRVMVPIRLVAESLDAEVKWDATNREVVINTAQSSEESWRLLKVNGEPTTWPYWIIDGKLYMEYRNLVDLLETKYKTTWHQVDYNSINNSYLIDRKSIKVYPRKVGEFMVIPLEDLQRNGVITYEWQAEEENLVFDLTN